jgi:hypothetical protein
VSFCSTIATGYKTICSPNNNNNNNNNNNKSRLEAFENRVLRRAFRSKKDKVREEWRRLHNEKLCDL